MNYTEIKQEIQNKLSATDGTLTARFSIGHFAHASFVEDSEGNDFYQIDYAIGEDVPYSTETFGDAEACATEMMKIAPSADLWIEDESDYV